MNKKLTLLIALSILLFFIIIILTGSIPTGGAAVVTTTPTTTTTTLPPTTTTTITTTTTTTTTTTSAAPVSLAEQVWRAMKAKGWNDDVCAGIMGNIMAECGGGTLEISAYLDGDGKTSFGLCQWHNERKTNMLKFNDKNYNTTTNLPPIEHQIDFIEYELNLYNIDIIDSDKNYEEVAYEFCVEFEIPKNKYKKAEQRKQFAKIAYQEFAI